MSQYTGEEILDIIWHLRQETLLEDTKDKILMGTLREKARYSTFPGNP